MGEKELAAKAKRASVISRVGNIIDRASAAAAAEYYQGIGGSMLVSFNEWLAGEQPYFVHLVDYKIGKFNTYFVPDDDTLRNVVAEISAEAPIAWTHMLPESSNAAALIRDAAKSMTLEQAEAYFKPVVGSVH